MNVMRTTKAGIARKYQAGFAAASPQLQQSYQDCWASLQKQFDPGNPEPFP